MKIMYFIHSLVVGGAETIVTNYLIRLKNMGNEVVLLQIFDKHTFLNERLKQAGVRTVTVCQSDDKKLKTKIDSALNLRKQIQAERPDVIHVHTGLEKFRFVRYPADKMVFTLHSSWERSLKQGENHRKMLFKLIQKGMSVIVLNEKAQNDILAQFPKARVYKIPNGFDFEHIRDNTYDKAEFLQSIHVPEPTFILGHVGRFHKVKNHEKIIEVFSKVLEKKPNAYLLLIGGGSLEEEQRVHALVRKYDVEERVCFLGERQDATAVMSVFDCLIFPSYSEAFPLVLIEAQTLGVRSIVSDAVQGEICCNDNCLRLSLEENAEKWAEYVVGTCLTEKKYNLEEFDIKNVMQKHLKLYHAIL